MTPSQVIAEQARLLAIDGSGSSTSRDVARNLTAQVEAIAALEQENAELRAESDALCKILVRAHQVVGRLANIATRRQSAPVDGGGK